MDVSYEVNSLEIKSAIFVCKKERQIMSKFKNTLYFIRKVLLSDRFLCT